MKKLFTFLLVTAFSLLLIGCVPPTQEGNNQDNNQDDNQDDTQDGEYGTMTIENLTLYTNFPGRPIVKFSNPDYATELSDIYFEIDGTAVEFDGANFVVKEANKTVKVTAETDYHLAEFTITTKDYVTACKDQSNANFYITRANEKEARWKSAGSPKGGTIFIGDSFFDTEFWSNFYELYQGNNAFTTGISSSTTTDWEIWATKLLYQMEPANVVMHCGTNNLYDDRESSTQAFNNTKRLLETIHHHLPETKIYYFAIEPRTYGIGTSVFNPASYDTIQGVNTEMAAYCNQNDFMVYVDVTSNCYTSGFEVNSSFFRDGDGCHPKLENYMVYAKALKAAGLPLDFSAGATTTSISYSKANNLNTGNKTFIQENGTVLTKEFSISGTLSVTGRSNNAHIQFSFDDSCFQNRFLLWDVDNNNSLCSAYALNGDHINNASTKGVNVGDTVQFELVVTTKNAYLYIDGQLLLVFVSANPTACLFGAEGVDCTFTNLVITSKIEKSTEYAQILARSEIQQYEGNTTKSVVVL